MTTDKGFKLVPVEPTEEMLKALWVGECISAKEGYAAMLAAAPASPQAAQPVAYRYKEGQASWENEKPWEPTTVGHGEVLLSRKALAENGTFKGQERDWHLALTVEPLYTHADAGEDVPECFCVEHGLHIEQLKKERDTLRAQLAELAKAASQVAGFPAKHLRDARIALSTTAKPEACDHDWVDARNQYVKSGELCVKCGAIRSGNQTTDGAKPEADHE